MKFTSSWNYSPHPVSHDPLLNTMISISSFMDKSLKGQNASIPIANSHYLIVGTRQNNFRCSNASSTISIKTKVWNYPLHKVNISKLMMDLCTFWYNFHLFIFARIPNANRLKAIIYQTWILQPYLAKSRTNEKKH
jgi:hypothetical protein